MQLNIVLFFYCTQNKTQYIVYCWEAVTGIVPIPLIRYFIKTIYCVFSSLLEDFLQVI